MSEDIKNIVRDLLPADTVGHDHINAALVGTLPPMMWMPGKTSEQCGGACWTWEQLMRRQRKEIT